MFSLQWGLITVGCWFRSLFVLTNWGSNLFTILQTNITGKRMSAYVIYKFDITISLTAATSGFVLRFDPSSFKERHPA